MRRALGATQTARAGGALLLANARYWCNVAPLAHTQIARWERDALAIPDPLLAGAARGRLGEEHFNVELAATLATLAPRRQRARTVEAIVALQVMYDYLDTLTEQPTAAQLLNDPVGDARSLYEAMLDAVAPNEERGEEYYAGLRHSQDGGYLRALVQTVRHALGGLPSAGAIRDVACRAATRCVEAQVLVHAATVRGDAELERWASSEAAANPHSGARGSLGWPEFLAGAQASVLVLHALIAAAADPRTSIRDAERIDAVYLSIGALTMLDSLIDREQDAAVGEAGYGRHYDSYEQMATRLGDAARAAAEEARSLPHVGHHTMTLAGVVAFYASAPAASSPFARPAIVRLRGELHPLIAPTLLVMRVWRASKLLTRPRRVVSSR